MARVSESIMIEADADEVWELAGDPARIAEWVPSLSSATAEGDQRTCTLEQGGELVERIVERSDEGRFYEYEIVDAPLPLRSYRSRLAVEEHDGHAHVDWVAEFEPQRPQDEAQLGEAFAATYRSGLESLRGRLEVGNRS
ncbi:MAG: SRPBCC family protein [Solirubrobacteraceae bacterium]